MPERERARRCRGSQNLMRGVSEKCLRSIVTRDRLVGMTLLLTTRRCTPRERPQENTIWALREVSLARPDSMFVCRCTRFKPPSSRLRQTLPSFPFLKMQLMMTTQRTLQALREGRVCGSTMNKRRAHAHQCEPQQTQFRPTSELNTLTSNSGGYIMDRCRSIFRVLLTLG